MAGNAGCPLIFSIFFSHRTRSMIFRCAHEHTELKLDFTASFKASCGHTARPAKVQN